MSFLPITFVHHFNDIVVEPLKDVYVFKLSQINLLDISKCKGYVNEKSEKDFKVFHANLNMLYIINI